MKLGFTVCLLLLTAAPAAGQTGSTAAVSPGESLFQAQCGFCHGRDATGGASGPDLTDSELVAQDRAGNKLGPVIRTGRPERGMPGFPLSDRDLKSVIEDIHARKLAVDKNPGRRRRVTIADLSTGNVEAGRARTSMVPAVVPRVIRRPAISPASAPDTAVWVC